MLDSACNDDCCDGTRLPHRVDEFIHARCACGAIVRYNPERPASLQTPCSCGLPLAESVLANASIRDLDRLRPLTKHRTRHHEHRHDPVVYFAEVYFPDADNHLIKIGTSGDVWNRMNAFRGVLLGVVPGWITEERAMHRRFAHHHSFSEYFRRGPDLLQFIAEKTTMPAYDPDPPAAPRSSQPVLQSVVRRMQQDIIPR